MLTIILLAQKAGRSTSINSVVCKSVLKWLIEGSIRLMVVDGGGKGWGVLQENDKIN